MNNINLLLGSLSLLWISGFWVTQARCRRAIGSFTVEKLPFEDPRQPPKPFGFVQMIYIFALIGLVLAGPASLSLLLMKLQRLVLWRSDSVALFNSENFLIFWFPGFPLAMGLFGAFYQSILARFPEHEIYQAFGTKAALCEWTPKQMTRRVEAQRLSNARILAWAWVLAYLPMILGVDSYVHVTRQGVIDNAYWGLGEKEYGWNQIQEAQLSGKLTESKGKINFNPHFVVWTEDGRRLELLGDAPFPVLPFDAVYDAAVAFRKNGVIVTVVPIDSEQERALGRKTEYWQGRVRKLWGDVGSIE